MNKKILKVLIILMFIIIISILILNLLSHKVMPIYLSYQESELKRLIITVINKSVSENFINEDSFDNLFIIKDDKNTNMTMIDFDPVVLNKVISNIADIVYTNIKLISEKDKDTLEKYNVSDSVFYIPSGVIFDSTFLNNLGPRIPVNMEIISSVNPSVETKVTEYGINNSLVEVFINVNANIKMIFPLASSEVEVKVVVPLTVKIIQGMVPDYYLGGLIGQTKSS